MPLSNRNKSIDLQSKSIDWFLCERGTGCYRVKWSECWRWSLFLRSNLCLKGFSSWTFFERMQKCLDQDKQSSFRRTFCLIFEMTRKKPLLWCYIFTFCILEKQCLIIIVFLPHLLVPQSTLLCLTNRPFQKTCGQSVTHMLSILVKYVNQSIQKWTKKIFLKAVFYKFCAVHSSKKPPSQIPDLVLNEKGPSKIFGRQPLKNMK